MMYDDFLVFTIDSRKRPQYPSVLELCVIKMFEILNLLSAVLLMIDSDHSYSFFDHHTFLELKS